MSRTLSVKRKHFNPKWKEHFYISRRDMTVMYLFFVVYRIDKSIAAGGFTEMKQAKAWAEKNWQTAIDEKIDLILLKDTPS